MDYLKILKRSANYVWKFKFLWLLGILTASGSFFGGGSNYSYAPDSLPKELEELNILGDETARNIFNIAEAEVSSVGKVIGDSIGPSMVSSIWLWLILVFLVLVFIVIGIYLNVAAKSAIVFAIDSIDQDKKTTLKSSWKLGHKYFWRRLSLDIIYALLILLPLMVLSIPVVVMVIFNLTTLAIIFGILFGIIFAVYAVYLAILLPYSERYLVLKNHRALVSIKEAKGLFTKNWGEILIMYAIVYVANMLLMLAFVFALIIVAVPLFLIGLGLWYIHPVVMTIYAIMIVFILFIIFVVVGGMINAFYSSTITLTYRELVKR